MKEEISNEELNELLTLIRVQYGYDFSGYAVSSLKRRIDRSLRMAGMSLFDLKYNIVNDEAFFYWFKRSLTVNVTEMFRDPQFYKKLRSAVLPILATYPIIKIWHAGCATGEEPFSMAILLHEAGLLERSRIYATDLNSDNLGKAISGHIPLTQVKAYGTNYELSGGTGRFTDYYTADPDNDTVSINGDLRKNIIFSQHNLVTDYIFNEFQLICCRNVLIYFNRDLQHHVLNLFYKSLAPLGFLALGTKESLLATELRDKFEIISTQDKIYRLKNER